MSLVLNGGKSTVTFMDGKSFKSFIDTCGLWIRNRNIDRERVIVIRDYEVENYKLHGTYTFADTPVLICEVGGDKLIIDGQHRISAWLNMKCPADSEWLVYRRQCKDEGEVMRIFESINCGTPVSSTYYNEKVNNVITKALEQFGSKEIISKSEACQCPNFNIKKTCENFGSNVKFRDAIISGKIDSKIILATLYQLNDSHKSTLETIRADKPKIYKTAMEKGYYITAFKMWENIVISRIFENLQHI